MPSERAHTVKTPLPPDDAGVDRLLLRSMKVKERISSPFEYVVELVSEDFEVDANELLGESMTIIVNVQDRSRYFNGLVSNFVHLGRAITLTIVQRCGPGCGFFVGMPTAESFKSCRLPRYSKRSSRRRTSSVTTAFH